MTKTKDPSAPIAEGFLNEIVYVETRRSDGSLRIQQDFQFCPTLAEQHTSHLSDLNYLIAKYKPDEIAAYIAAKNQHKQEIVGHDFSLEPNLQEAKNITYRMKENFKQLPDEVRNNFKNHLEFLKFIDNPANQDKLIKLGLMTKKEIAESTSDALTRTQDEATAKDKPSDLPPNPKK